jgi:anthranilate/para-aminobenzoate synthase component II
MQAGRYHSLLVSEQDLPGSLEVSAYTPDGEIMGLRVAGTRTEGVQFHPESILTADGARLLANFLKGAV